MLNRQGSAFIAWTYALFGLAWTAPAFAADPLFATANEPIIEATLTLPLREVLKKSTRGQAFSGQFTTQGESYQVSVTVRGKSRLERCRFPPLRLNFKKSEVKGSLLHKQDRLKLVTHCETRFRTKGYLAAEMLAYRLLNMVTDTSFRVRALNITYLDSSKATDETDQATVYSAFLIEDKSRLAKRLDGKLFKTKSVKSSQHVPAYTARIALFQYMIGNTDYSVLRGPPDDDCCHNAVPIGTKVSADATATEPGKDIVPDQIGGTVFVVPYDFDSSGLVNPPYAVPAQNLGLKRLTQRKFRGRCRHNQALLEARLEFLTLRPKIESLIQEFADVPHLDRKRTGKFLGQFFDVLQDESAFQKRILKQCR